MPELPTVNDSALVQFSNVVAGSELPDGWRKARFGELALHISDRVDDPKAAGVGIYVGLEHLEPGSLKIKRRGTPDDVNATKLRVKPGQIIFGKRRAYQRKVAVADFEGICSAHAMVLEANPETTALGFLPFFMQSDIFFDRALAISEGSLSPTIKWKTLAAQEFLIPPIERQEELVKLFQAIEDAIAATEESIAAAEQLKRSLMHELLTKGIGHTEFKKTELGVIPNLWKITPLSECLEGVPESGFSPLPSPNDTGFYVLALGALTQNGYVDGQWKPINREHFDEAMLLKQGDFLISRSNTQKLVGFVGIFQSIENPKVIFSDLMMRLHINEIIIKKWYLMYYLQSSLGRKLIQSIAAGTSGSMKKINKGNLLKVRVALPEHDEQERISNLITGVQQHINQIRTHQSKIGKLKFQIINSLLSGQHDLTLTEPLRELTRV